MSDQRRRFRPRPQRSGFRPRNNNGQNSNGHFQSNGGGNISRNNGSMTNPFNVEKTAQKYQQLAKDALTSGDPVLHENYLQHAEHFVRVLNERNARNNNESKTSVTSTSEAENKNTSPEKLKDSVSDEPVDIIKVLKPIPMEDNSDSEDEPDVKEANPIKKKADKKTAISKK